MDKKKQSSHDPDFYCEGSPLMIRSVHRGSPLGGKYSLRLTLEPVTSRMVKEADVCIFIPDSGNTIQETVHGTNHSIISGTAVTIHLPAGTQEFCPGISRAVFEDGEEWICTGSWTALTPKVLLEDALRSSDKADEFRARFGTDCLYVPQEERGLWTCICGTSNLLSEERCLNCRRKYSGLRALGIDVLKIQGTSDKEDSPVTSQPAVADNGIHELRQDHSAEMEEILQQPETETEHKKEEKKPAKEKKKNILLHDDPVKADTGDTDIASKPSKGPKNKLKSILPFVLIPVVLLVVVLIATIPGFLRNKSDYSQATQYLAENQFDEAAAAFEALGTYSDSQEQVAKNIPYQKAMYLIRCADNGDSSALRLLGLDKNAFENSDQIRIALYSGAVELLQTLDGYKDCAKQIDNANYAIKEIEQSRYQESYHSAAELLEQGHYNQAKAAFTALADYEDSAEMVKECDYQKGCELLAFCEKYSTQKIYAYISYSVDENSIFSFNDDAALHIGTDGVTELYSLLSADGAEVMLEDAPSAENMIPFCDAVAQLFENIPDYKDSADLAHRAKEAGDFTKPFYEYCSSGDISGAISWLKNYDGDFENRDGWLATLDSYLPLINDWTFATGDPTLIPLTAGSDTQSYSVSSQILISDDTVTLRLYYDTMGSSIDLYASLGEVKFAFYGDFSYFSSLNNSGNLTYVKYGDNGLLSSCEYHVA